MLSITADTTDATEVVADVLVVPTFKAGITGPGAGAALDALGMDGIPTTPTFRGDIGQTLLLAAPGQPYGALMLVGVGRMDDVGPAQLRRAAAAAGRAARPFGKAATTLALLDPASDEVAAVAEGFYLGAHADDRFRSEGRRDPAPALEEVVILAPSSRLWEAKAAIEQATIAARAQLAARDLVALPPSDKTPPKLAEAIAELCGEACTVRILEEAELATEGFGGLIAVGAGSNAPPRLVELRYTPEAPIGRVVLVGKGITFDSGGYSLKNPQQMQDMKSDMAGAAAVAGACSALAAMDVRIEVIGLCALAENLVSGAAQRPSDVITIHGGTTVEVMDTDAEGRLVLADALDLARSMDADAIVDLATLTGSVIHGLGWYAAGAMGNDADLLSSLEAAGDAAGEDLWELPLWRDLDPFLESTVADVRNIADTGQGPGGGALTAALFLQRFVGDTPWVHLDIAGPAFIPPEMARPWLAAGPTGFGVRTLLAWLGRPR